MKNVPQPVAAQLEFCAKPDVAGEQAEYRRIRQRLQAMDEFPDAMAHFAITACQDVVEPENVALEKLAEMFLRFRQSVDFEKFADKAHVGAPGELHFFRAVVQVEFRRERFGERLCSGVSGMDERAVNVE